MKKIFFIAACMVVGLFLEIGVSCATYKWESTGPTAEDIQAATKVEKLAVKGSIEDTLLSAVKNDQLNTIKTCIAAGADLEARDNQDMTALMWAAEKGYSNIANILINSGADINTADKFGCTAFFKAADKNHVDVVKILMANGAARDKNFKDVLVSSVLKGNTEMVKALIIESARIKDDTLETAYMIALNRRRSNPEIYNLIAQALNKTSQ